MNNKALRNQSRVYTASNPLFCHPSDGVVTSVEYEPAPQLEQADADRSNGAELGTQSDSDPNNRTQRSKRDHYDDLTRRSRRHDPDNLTRRIRRQDPNAQTRRIARPAASKAQSTPSASKPAVVQGTLRPGSFLRVTSPLPLGHDVLDVGENAVVEAVFPKLRLRKDATDYPPATVEFDTAMNRAQRIPTVEGVKPYNESADSIAYSVQIIDET